MPPPVGIDLKVPSSHPGLVPPLDTLARSLEYYGTRSPSPVARCPPTPSPSRFTVATFGDAHRFLPDIWRRVAEILAPTTRQSRSLPCVK